MTAWSKAGARAPTPLAAESFEPPPMQPFLTEAGAAVSGASGLDLSAAIEVPIPNWAAAERLGLALMIALGFEDSQLTGSGSDGGIDVLHPEAGCQVKYRAERVGRPSVQKLHGAALGRKAIYLSLSGFKAGPVQWATEAGVALFRYDTGAHVWPENAEARLLASRCTIAPMSERERNLATRVARAHRWIAATTADAGRIASQRAVGWRHDRRRAKRLAAFNARLPTHQKHFAKVEATRRKVAR